MHRLMIDRKLCVCQPTQLSNLQTIYLQSTTTTTSSTSSSTTTVTD